MAHGRVRIPSVHDLDIHDLGRFPFPLDSRQIVFDLVVVNLPNDLVVARCGVQFG